MKTQPISSIIVITIMIIIAIFPIILINDMYKTSKRKTQQKLLQIQENHCNKLEQQSEINCCKACRNLNYEYLQNIYFNPMFSREGVNNCFCSNKQQTIIQIY